MQIKARGSALITALFIMTLVAIAATAMSLRLQLDIYRTQLTLTNDKLYLASQAVTFWAMSNLTENNNHSQISSKVNAIVYYPSQLEHAYPAVITKGSLHDLQAFFNINNLQDSKFHPQFARLMENVLKKSTAEERKTLINAIQYWINPYQPERGHDDHLNAYLTQKPAYLPGYQPMQSISELRMVNGMSAKMYQSLLPFITVLPEKTFININTAPKSVLMTLVNGLSETDIDELLQARGKKGIKNAEKLHQLLQKLDIPSDQVTIESTYFLSTAAVVSEDLSLKTYTVIKRTKDRNGRLSISIVSEYLNIE